MHRMHSLNARVCAGQRPLHGLIVINNDDCMIPFNGQIVRGDCVEAIEILEK